MKPPKHWIITQQQITSGDIESAILPVDPQQLPDREIRRLLGRVRLHVESARGPQDMFTQPAARAFFRQLQARWPWAGFFLTLSPITHRSSPARICDVGVFLALILCRVDDLTYIESSDNFALRLNPQAYSTVLDDLLARANQLAEEVGLPNGALAARQQRVCLSLASLFAAAKQIKQAP